MHFEWNDAKNRRNLAKHGISFDIAKSLFEDPFALSVQDRVAHTHQKEEGEGVIGAYEEGRKGQR